MAELANFSAIVTYFSFAVHCTFTPIGLFFRYLFTITAKIATFLKTKYPTFFWQNRPLLSQNSQLFILNTIHFSKNIAPTFIHMRRTRTTSQRARSLTQKTRPRISPSMRCKPVLLY